MLRLNELRKYVYFDREDMFFRGGCFKVLEPYRNPYGYMMRVGDVIGAIREDGLWRIRLFGTSYNAQQLSWFYHYGMWGDRVLAGECGPACLLPERLYNWTLPENTVWLQQSGERWKATVRVRNKKVVLGRDYPDRQAAAAACDAAVHDGWNPELCVDAAEWEMLYGI